MDTQFDEYPNTVFRFRPYNALSLKELQYGEVFFVANDELNDPYDTKNPHYFENTFDAYKRLIIHILNPKPGMKISLHIDIDAIATFLCQKGLLHDELLQLVSSEEFYIVVTKAFGRNLSPVSLVFITQLKSWIINAGGLCYIASFSKNYTNPVIWSHYANHHKGFCLCFSIKDGIFNPDKSFTDNKFFKASKFEEVIYDVKNVTTNGFYMFPGSILGQSITEEERLNYWRLRRQAYLTKYKSWDYEQEVRIVIDDWFDVRASENGAIKKQIVDRIFSYDQTQLTGIIFGSKMNSDAQQEIRSIIYKLRTSLLQRGNKQYSEDYLPIFIFYQAKENPTAFPMNVEAIDGLDATNRFFHLNEIKKKKEEYNNLKELYSKRKTTG